MDAWKMIFTFWKRDDVQVVSSFNMTCNFSLRRIVMLLLRAFAREHYYKLFHKSFAASILAFAEPSDIIARTQYMNGFRRCSSEY